jgi:hypothetical protein
MSWPAPVIFSAYGAISRVTSIAPGQTARVKRDGSSWEVVDIYSIAESDVITGALSDAISNNAVAIAGKLPKLSTGLTNHLPIIDAGGLLVDSGYTVSGLLNNTNLTGTPTATTPASNDNTNRVATMAAVQSALAAAVSGLLDLKGSTDASANPNYLSASKGDAYVVNVAGKVGGASGKSVDVGDMVVAMADNAGGTEAAVGTSWVVLEHNIVGALLGTNNLSDVSNPATARANIGANNASNLNTGTVAVARLTAAVQAAAAATANVIVFNTLAGITGAGTDASPWEGYEAALAAAFAAAAGPRRMAINGVFRSAASFDVTGLRDWTILCFGAKFIYTGSGDAIVSSETSMGNDVMTFNLRIVGGLEVDGSNTARDIARLMHVHHSHFDIWGHSFTRYGYHSQFHVGNTGYMRFGVYGTKSPSPTMGISGVYLDEDVDIVGAAATTTSRFHAIVVGCSGDGVVLKCSGPTELPALISELNGGRAIYISETSSCIIIGGDLEVNTGGGIYNDGNNSVFMNCYAEGPHTMNGDDNTFISCGPAGTVMIDNGRNNRFPGCQFADGGGTTKLSIDFKAKQPGDYFGLGIVGGSAGVRLGNGTSWHVGFDSQAGGRSTLTVDEKGLIVAPVSAIPATDVAGRLFGMGGRLYFHNGSGYVNVSRPQLVDHLLTHTTPPTLLVPGDDRIGSTTLTDVSGNGFDFTISGSPTLESSPLAYQDPTHSVLWDGATSYASRAYTATFNTPAISLFAAIKTTSTSGTKSFFDRDGSGRVWQFRHTGTTLSIIFFLGGSPVEITTSGVNDGKPHLVAATYSPGTLNTTTGVGMVLWVDGVAVNGGTQTGALAQPTQEAIVLGATGGGSQKSDAQVSHCTFIKATTGQAFHTRAAAIFKTGR